MLMSLKKEITKLRLDRSILIKKIQKSSPSKYNRLNQQLININRKISDLENQLNLDQSFNIKHRE